MHSLFWKILISFWVSLILFAGLTMWSTSYYLETIRSDTSVGHPRVKMQQYIQQAQTVARIHGMDGLRKWLTELDRRETIPYLLIDEQGTDLINRPVPYRLQKRVQRYERRMQHEYDEHENENEYEHRRSHRRPIIIDGKRYRLLPDFHAVTLSRVLNRPRVIAIPILIAALISGIVCYFLAGYLTTPITRLRQATRKFANGDLDERVGPVLGKRKDEMADLAKDFDQMALQLQNLISSHKQLLRDASHELRSPLARLQVALGLARKRTADTIDAELDRIDHESERLNELIGKLLSVARLETGYTDMKKEEIRLDGLLEELADDAAYEARALNRDVAISDNVAAEIRGNRVLLHSALENVVRNAIRYTAEHTTVELSMQFDVDHPGFVKITVRDHGPGIPDEMLSRIFEPFVRVGEARDRESGGYGLGLAIASRAIKLHGGNISASNMSGNGASVEINLPVETNA